MAYLVAIAGHMFDLGTIGQVRCTMGDCGALYTDIMQTQKSDIGRNGIAHSGALTEGEYASIVKEQDRLMATLRS